MSDLIETLTSYVPALITRRLVTDPAPITMPIADQFPAAALLADISGFTALTERLAHQGPAGAEELTRLLNAYFGQFIDLIQVHGGDIVKFAGDALLALWPVGVTDEDLATVTYRAAQCGLLVQAVLHDLPVGEDVRLSHRVGIGAGEVLLKHVGGVFGRWEFLVAGAPLAQLSLAGRLAQPGQVVISPEAWKLISRRCSGTPITAAGEVVGARLEDVGEPLPFYAAARPALTAEAETALRAYIPGAILARLAAGQSGWLAELRRVSVIFVNLPDLSYAMPLEQAQAVMRTLQATLYHYEGSINKLSVDDKGISLVAALGLPPLAHEDDAARAVQAALAMQAELRHLGLRSAIGVTTGQAFCGSIGHAVRREYTMLGDVVNLAARLMQAAPGDILCDAVTCQAAQAQVPLLAFEALPAIQVKGKAEPVAVYRPLGSTGSAPAGAGLARRHRSRVTLVGREAERAILAEELQALLRRGAGSVVMIEGEAGIGKSRLVEDALEKAHALDVITLIGAGDAIEKSTPYHAWRPIFRQLFGLEGSGSEAEAWRAHVLARLMAEFGPDSELLRLAPLLDVVLAIDTQDNEITARMTGKVRADNTQRLLVELLQKVTQRGHDQPERPYLIVLDDAHWLDSASWALALLVNRQIQPADPLLMIIATRPLSQPWPDEYSQLRRAAGIRHIELDHLPVAEALALVCQRLGVASLPEPVAALIRDKAEGHPFFSEELAYALRDSGLITLENGTCRLTVEADRLEAALDFPDTVQGVVTSRIDRLPPSQQLTLKVASVIGRIFAVRTLRDIYPIETDRDHLPAYLETLARLDITPLEAQEPELAYIFKHIITQEVAYNMMLFAQRQKLHRSAAEWYEQKQAGDLAPFYPLLAHHWRRAGVVDKAIDYLEKAGEQALHGYASQEAVRFFSRAIELAEQHPSGNGGSGSGVVSPQRRAHWELQLGKAYVHWRRLGEGRKHLEQGLARLNFGIPAGQASLVKSLLGQVWQQVRYRFFRGRGPVVPAESRAILLEAARAYEALLEVYYFANEMTSTLYAAFRALNLAEAAGLSPELARGYTSVGAIIGFVPLHGVANVYCRHALDIARKLDDMPAQIWVSLGTGIYYAGVGHWRKAHQLLREVVALSEELGDGLRWDDGISNLVLVNYFQGEVAAALKLSEDLYRSAGRRSDAHNQAWALRGKVYCLLAMGEFEPALGCLETLQGLLAGEADVVDEALHIDTHSLLALVYLHQGSDAQALAQADEAAKLIARSSPTSFPSLVGYAGVAEVYLRLWGRELAGELRLAGNGTAGAGLQHRPLKIRARRACEAMMKFARVFPIGEPRAWLWQGWFDQLSGHPLKARRAWQKSLALAGRLAMPYEQGLAHSSLGQSLPPDDPARSRHLACAGEILARLGLAAADLK